MPAFTGSQMAKWLYTQHVTSIDDMTNLSKANRERLKEQYVIGCMPPADCQESKDGTKKYLFPVGGNNHSEPKYVETVYIPDGERATLCVSSQIGCKMNCLFCQTRATEILTADYGYAWSPKRITVSSVGIKNKLKRFLDESDCHVAISLHSPLPDQRAQLMPAERGMGIQEVIDLLRNYDFSHQRRLSFEYIVFSGVNDSEKHARAIIQLLKGLECRINLIRFHQIPGVDLKGTSDQKMEAFRDYLTQHGVFTTIRASRGQDIFAACGLLSTAKKKSLGT